DPHPLTLAAGQLTGIARGELRWRKSDLSQETVYTGIDVARLPTHQTRNQSDISGHSEMRKEARILDHVPDPTPQPDQIPGGRGYPLDQDVAGTWQVQAIHHFQGGSLARPTSTQKHHSFSGFDIETEIVQNIFLTDASRNLLEGDKRLHALNRRPGIRERTAPPSLPPPPQKPHAWWSRAARRPRRRCRDGWSRVETAPDRQSSTARLTPIGQSLRNPWSRSLSQRVATRCRGS